MHRHFSRERRTERLPPCPKIYDDPLDAIRQISSKPPLLPFARLAEREGRLLGPNQSNHQLN